MNLVYALYQLDTGPLILSLTPWRKAESTPSPKLFVSCGLTHNAANIHAE
jgi:hypothetical protein